MELGDGEERVGGRELYLSILAAVVYFRTCLNVEKELNHLGFGRRVG